MKKTLLTLGTITTIATPVVAVVSCGKKQKAPEQKHEKKVADSVIAKKFLDLFLADENNVVQPIHHDSTEEFVNIIIGLWTKAEKDSGVKHTSFAPGYRFVQSNTSSVNHVTDKMTNIIKGLIEGLLKGKTTSNSTLSSILPRLKDIITKDLVRGFLQEKYASAGVLSLFKGLIDGVLNIPLVHSLGTDIRTAFIWDMIVKALPFKEDANHTNVSASFENNTLVLQYKTTKTLASFISNISLAASTPAPAPAAQAAGAGNTAGSSASTQTPVAPTKLGMGSLMKVLGDQATKNLVSGLLTYLAANHETNNLLKALIRKAGNQIIHIDGTQPFNSGNSILSIEIDSQGTAVENIGRPTKGLIDWYRTTRDSKNVLVDRQGHILAEISGANIKFLVDKLPVKANVGGKQVVRTDSGITREARGELQKHEISLRELISEIELKDAMALASVAYAMILAKMESFGIEGEWANDPKGRTDVQVMVMDTLRRMFVPGFQGIHISDSAISAAHAVGATDVENHLKGIKESLNTIHTALPSGNSLLSTLANVNYMSAEEKQLVENINAHGGVSSADPDDQAKYQATVVKAINAYIEAHAPLKQAVTQLFVHMKAVQIPAGLKDIVGMISGHTALS